MASDFSIGNGSINSFALLLPETFTSDLYTEIYVQADGAQEEASYSDAYDETVKAVQTKIEALEDAACDRRYTAVKTEGQEENKIKALNLSEMHWWISQFSSL